MVAFGAVKLGCHLIKLIVYLYNLLFIKEWKVTVIFKGDAYVNDNVTT